MAAKFIDRLLKFTTYTTFGATVLGGLGYSCLYTVDGGERAIMMDYISGIKDDVVIPEGTHFRIPFKQRPIIFDVRIRPREITTKTGTKDLQTVNVTLRVLHRPVISKLPVIMKELGVDYDERILPSVGNEVMKAVIARYKADEIIQRREQVSREIQSMVRKRALEKFHIDLVDVSITDISFSKEFTRAVELKQVAEQEAERQAFLVEKSRYEKEAAVIRAEGEAIAADMISKAMTESGSGLIELRKIEASKEIANVLSRSKNITYLPKDTPYLITK
ncbi:hypothetical protein ABK040_004046 [Willaertia magna]